MSLLEDAGAGAAAAVGVERVEGEAAPPLVVRVEESLAMRRGVEGEAVGAERCDDMALAAGASRARGREVEGEEGEATGERTPEAALGPAAPRTLRASETGSSTTRERDDDCESERTRLCDGGAVTGAGSRAAAPLAAPDRPTDARTAACLDGVAGALDAAREPDALVLVLARAGDGGGGMRWASALSRSRPTATEAARTTLGRRMKVEPPPRSSAGGGLGLAGEGDGPRPALESDSCLTSGEPTGGFGLGAVAVDARGVSDVVRRGASAARCLPLSDDDEGRTTISLSASESELPSVDAAEGDDVTVRSSSSRPSVP